MATQLALVYGLVSNTTLLGLVIGFLTIKFGGLAVIGDFYLWEFGVASLVGLAPVLLLLDGNLSRVDGLILLVICLIYAKEFLFMKRLKMSGELLFKKRGLLIGNLLGIIVVNAVLFTGIAALATPAKNIPFRVYGLAGFSFLMVFGLFWLFSRSKKRLSRSEGLVLVGVYLMFAGLVWLYH